mmetsp:Transcript_3290/g.8219  ORF Transcript_3290/g.8219 Transcript_3290/m.8219 type:complete len:274 (+) Transcript_3290:262-1083(+)
MGVARAKVEAGWEAGSANLAPGEVRERGLAEDSAGAWAGSAAAAVSGCGSCAVRSPCGGSEIASARCGSRDPPLKKLGDAPQTRFPSSRLFPGTDLRFLPFRAWYIFCAHAQVDAAHQYSCSCSRLDTQKVRGLSRRATSRAPRPQACWNIAAHTGHTRLPTHCAPLPTLPRSHAHARSRRRLPWCSGRRERPPEKGAGTKAGIGRSQLRVRSRRLCPAPPWSPSPSSAACFLASWGRRRVQATASRQAQAPGRGPQTCPDVQSGSARACALP